MLGVWFLLQLGEMVLDKEPFDPQIHFSTASLGILSCQDVPLSVPLHLNKTKTDQQGVGQTRAVSCVCARVPHLMCPVHLALALLTRRSSTVVSSAAGEVQATTFANGQSCCLPACPQLVTKDGEVLRRSQVVSAIKWLVAHLGLDPTQYVGHSLRRGGVTSAMVAGLSPVVIQQMGG